MLLDIVLTKIEVLAPLTKSLNVVFECNVGRGWDYLHVYSRPKLKK